MIQLPEQFIQQLNVDFPNRYDEIIAGYSQQAPISIRLNPQKSNFLTLPDFPTVPWESQAFYLNERPLFTSDPLFHSGVYYVQEASSMLIGHFVRQILKEHTLGKVLDLSAAPGGKTTHLVSILPTSTLIVANEIIKSRALILRENLTKWGNTNVVVTSDSASSFEQLHQFFDLIVLDAPCSGEGMFRKDPDSIQHWSEKAVGQCAVRQQDILNSAWKALKPGGFLLYSTCTLNKTENEDVLKQFAENQSAKFIPLNDASSFNLLCLGEESIYRCVPGVHLGEGFSFACLQKTEQSEYSANYSKPKKQSLLPIQGKERNELDAYTVDSLDWFKFQNYYLGIHPRFTTDILQLQAYFHILKAGVRLGERKGNEIRPEHEWVLSDQYRKNTFTEVELTLENAVRYLRKDVLNIPIPPSTSYLVATYMQIPLGLMKTAGSRLNNLFPMDWRIRMSIQEKQLFSFFGLTSQLKVKPE